MMSVQQRFQKLLESRGLTQRDVARAAGIHDSQISRLFSEGDKSSAFAPTKVTLYHTLAKMLGPGPETLEILTDLMENLSSTKGAQTDVDEV